MTVPDEAARGALADLRVVDASTLFAGPMAAMHLGDLGAQVTKVEHPRRPDPARGHGPEKDGQNLWWKTLGRNKRTVQLDLSTDGRRRGVPSAAARRPTSSSRTSARTPWSAGGCPTRRCRRATPGWSWPGSPASGRSGRTGDGPGFGTLAEAMSGFAASTGEPDGPPTLPPFGLADGIASLATAFAIMSALHQRAGHRARARSSTSPSSSRSWRCSARRSPGGTSSAPCSRGSATAPATTRRATPTGPPTTSGSPSRPARRTSPSASCGWSAGEELVAEPWFAAGRTRAEHADVLDEAVGGWIAGAHPGRGHRGVRAGRGRGGAGLHGRGHRRATRSSRRWGPSAGSTTPTSASWRCRARCSGCPTATRRPGTPGEPPAPTPTPCSPSWATPRRDRALRAPAARQACARSGA